MGLPLVPVIRKFFTNKIESSRPEWGDYLLEIADIFSMFDGEELDRELLTERFSVISGRSPYALRDVANFRDEFGSYGTYLGIFHTENIDGQWRIYLSKAAKHFLCSTEPDVEAFCRTQMALFQYPNGAGAVAGTRRMQNNAKNDTIREVQNGIRLNPLRLICRVALTLHVLYNIPLSEIIIPYKTIFMLFNDDAINRNYTPSLDTIKTALESYRTLSIPNWVNDGKSLSNFKRNFHILERTGIFQRKEHIGLSLNSIDLNRSYTYAKTISGMQYNFEGFEKCYDATDIEQQLQHVVLSPQWGKYFDAFTIPMNILTTLSDDVDIFDREIATPPIGTLCLSTGQFPELRDFRTMQIRAFSPSGQHRDLFETIVCREKANREHARILTMLAAKLRANNHDALENVYIDLYTNIAGHDYIFEVKSNNERNALSQIRKAIAQLYEYRYRSGKREAVLCIVLQQKPIQDWVEDYLLHDRKILMCWLVDDVRLECPAECHVQLADIGIIG